MRCLIRAVPPQKSLILAPSNLLAVNGRDPEPDLGFRLPLVNITEYGHSKGVQRFLRSTGAAIAEGSTNCQLPHE